jgi:hypothetical protein
MKATLTLTVKHPKITNPVTHTDNLNGSSVSAILKKLNLPGKQMCDLKHHNSTSWTDFNGATHKLEIQFE